MPSSRPLPARRIEANTSFLPLIVGASIVRQRRLDRDHFELEIARHLVAHQMRDLAQQPAEARDRGFLVAHDRQLVLDHRVIDDRCTLAMRTPARSALQEKICRACPARGRASGRCFRQYPRRCAGVQPLPGDRLGKSTRIGICSRVWSVPDPARIVAVVGGEHQQIVVPASWRSVRAAAGRTLRAPAHSRGCRGDGRIPGRNRRNWS